MLWNLVLDHSRHRRLWRDLARHVSHPAYVTALTLSVPLTRDAKACVEMWPLNFHQFLVLVFFFFKTWYCIFISFLNKRFQNPLKHFGWFFWQMRKFYLPVSFSVQIWRFSEVICLCYFWWQKRKDEKASMLFKLPVGWISLKSCSFVRVKTSPWPWKFGFVYSFRDTARLHLMTGLCSVKEAAAFL